MDLRHRGEGGLRLELYEVIFEIVGKFNQVDGRNF
jgi:hypothetical protein